MLRLGCLAGPVTTPAAALRAWRRAPCMINCSTFSSMPSTDILSVIFNSYVDEMDWRTWQKLLKTISTCVSKQTRHFRRETVNSTKLSKSLVNPCRTSSLPWNWRQGSVTWRWRVRGQEPLHHVTFRHGAAAGHYGRGLSQGDSRQEAPVDLFFRYV